MLTPAMVANSSRRNPGVWRLPEPPGRPSSVGWIRARRLRKNSPSPPRSLIPQVSQRTRHEPGPPRARPARVFLATGTPRDGDRMAPAHVLVIGGSSGMGLALAERLVLDGAEVTIAGRSTDRLAAAAKGIDQPDRLRTHQVDIGSEAEVAAILAATAPLHHVVVTAADAKDATGPIPGFALDNARAVLDTKLLGPWLVAKHAGPHLAPGGSLTFTSGVSAYRPGPGASITAA